jgi:hypothetical protein
MDSGTSFANGNLGLHEELRLRDFDLRQRVQYAPDVEQSSRFPKIAITEKEQTPIKPDWVSGSQGLRVSGIRGQGFGKK